MDLYLSSLLGRRDAIDDGDPNPLGDRLAHLSIVFASLAGMFVVLRLLTRYFNGKNLGIDDALVVGALGFTVCLTVTYNEEARNGFGLNSDQLSKEHQITAFKWFFVAQILYKIATCLTKLSLCTTYLLIFPKRQFRIFVIAIMGITIAYTVAAVLLTVFACKPIDKSWNKSLPGKCVDSRSIWYSTSVLNIVTDVMIITLPINEIRHLQLPLVKRILLGCLFSLGIFVVSCTIIRMITVSPQTTASDQTYYQAISNSWTFVETDVGIICACLPILRVPLAKSLRRALGLVRKDTTLAGNSNYGYGISTAGNVTTRVQAGHMDPAGDSVEDLITESNAIKMTATFKVDVMKGDK